MALEHGYKIGNHSADELGYEISYPDGYKSWCPAEEFDKYYYHIQDENGDMLYRNDIEDFIAKESVKVGTKTTNTTLTTITGFEVHGQSACVNPDNFNMQIGEQYASEKAKDQLWFALGFVLQWAVALGVLAAFPVQAEEDIFFSSLPLVASVSRVAATCCGRTDLGDRD